MSQETQVAPVATNTPFEYNENLTISIGVSDMEKAIEWYGEVLGLELVYKLERARLVRDVDRHEARDDRARADRGGQARAAPLPTFGVKDIDASRKHLESHDVRFDGDTYEIEGMVKLCMFYDPDGNSYMLAESLTTEIPS